MLETITPIPIVQQARVELPGLNALVNELKPLYQAARNTGALAHLAAWKLMARIFRYSERSEVQAEVDRLNRGPDGQPRHAAKFTAFRVVMQRLVKGQLVGPDGPQISVGHGGPLSLGARPECLRTSRRWRTEWSRVARVLGAADLTDIQVVYRLQERAQRDPAGVTATVEAALEKARKLAAEAAAAREGKSPPDFAALALRYARAFARRLRADGGKRLPDTQEDAVAVLRGLETGFRKSGLTCLAGLLAAASAQAGKEGSDEPGTPAATGA